MKKSTGKQLVMVLGLLAVAGWALQAGAQNAGSQQGAGQGQPGQQGQMMHCPMMEAMQALKLPADAPPVLLAQQEELQLTAEQQQKLKEIARQAIQQSREVLTDEQREKLADAPSGPLSPMELAKVLAKGKGGQQQAGQGKMCPMCQQMMQQRMQQRQGDQQ